MARCSLMAIPATGPRGALDQLAAALAAAPQLRRLGSVQLKLLRMLEPAAGRGGGGGRGGGEGGRGFCTGRFRFSRMRSEELPFKSGDLGSGLVRQEFQSLQGNRSHATFPAAVRNRPQ